jgi:hypothetical protein
MISISRRAERGPQASSSTIESKSIKKTTYDRHLGANSLSLGLSGRRPKVSEKGISSHDRVVDRVVNLVDSQPSLRAGLKGKLKEI